MLVGGGGWHVSNISIIFYCSMLLYYPFWMFMALTLHIYIIFGNNLLTEGPARIPIFLPILVFRRKGISNGVQTEWNLRERDFWNERDPEDLEWKSRNKRGGHESGGRPPTWRAPLSRGPLRHPPTYFFVMPSIQSYTNHTLKCVRSRSRTHGKISQHNSRHKLK